MCAVVAGALGSAAVGASVVADCTGTSLFSGLAGDSVVACVAPVPSVSVVVSSSAVVSVVGSSSLASVVGSILLFLSSLLNNTIVTIAPVIYNKIIKIITNIFFFLFFIYNAPIYKYNI